MAVADRIVSLLPSATEIVCALGLAHHLVGVSHSCDHPPLIRSKPRLTRARFPLDGLSSGEMDAAVRQALREFGSVYEVDNERLAAVAPDLLLTQGVSGRPSFAVQWAELVGLDPDVLLVMPCGFELAAARADADACRAPLGAVAPRAIRSGRAYAVDATAHFSRPGPRVADGVELLGALFHPDTFPGAPLEGRATVWA